MSGFFTFILVVQTLVAVTLIALILAQRSEGGGLAGGGSPAGMMSARGASDFLTRGTAILATAFVALSIVLAGLAAGTRGTRGIDPGLAKQAAPASAPASGSPPAAAPAAAPPAAPVPANQSNVPGR
jgi:preprotein translocase subunit SecG